MEEKSKNYNKKLYSNFSIRLAKRNNENNTHKNIVDESISEIIPYKIINIKFMFSIFLYMITFGTFYIFLKYFPTLYLKLNCVECDIRQADMFIILDHEGNFHLTGAFCENFYKRNSLLYYLFNFDTKNKTIKNSMQNSPYLGEDNNNQREESLAIYYRHNKYIYNENKKEFEPPKLDLRNFTNSEIHFIFAKGLKNALDYNYLLNKFGKNLIVLEGKSFIRILIENFLHPFYLYQIFSVGIWIKTGYISFCFIVIILAVIMIGINSYQNYVNFQRILNFNYLSQAKISRKLIDERSQNLDLSPKLDILNGESQYMVPGDVIELENNEKIPCDCILLDGYCTVNESDLTGESSLVMKSPLLGNDNKFDYNLNSKSILFNGTQIDKCESIFNEGRVRALVINTGFNTLRGDFIQNVLFPKPTNFKFYKDILAFFVGVLLIYIAAIIIYIRINNQKETPKEPGELVVLFLELLTIIFPPSLPICMTFSSYYFHYSLNSKNISCINDSRMNAAGRVNIIVLDKTGTLTEDGLDLFGYQTTRLKSGDQQNDSEEDSVSILEKSLIENEKTFDLKNLNKNEIEFDEVETSSKSFNILHRAFWKKFCEEKYLKNFFLNDQKTFASSGNKFKINSNSDGFIYNLIEEKDSFIQSNEENNLDISVKTMTKLNLNENPNDLNIISDDYQNDPKLNIIYFLECLATCHSIDKLNGNHIGNNVDRKIFDNLGWTQQRSDEEVLKYKTQEIKDINFTHKNTLYTPTITLSTDFKYFMIPKKAYKINEIAYFKNIFKISQNVQKFKDYKLTILKRFEFSSKFQSMSVIIYNNFDNTYRFFIKGSPEKIIQICNTNSIPSGFNNKLLEHTQNGFRVLACATKVLPKNENYECEIDRTKYENDLNFLGFIIFRNKLKKDTKYVISKLNKSHCKLVMATGDNPFTSISVARESEFISKSGNVFVVDLEKSKGDSKNELKFSLMSQKENLKNNLIQFKEDLNNKNISEFNDSKSNRRFLDSNIGNNFNSKNIYSGENFNLNTFLTIWKDNQEEDFYNNSSICISGSAFIFILNKYRKRKKEILISDNKKIHIDEDIEHKKNIEMLNILENFGKIYYRMSPNDKVELVNFLKENKDNIVAMCGDGANDCGALLSADTGISIKHKDGTNITSHFYCTDESISCIEIIIKNGRACFENSKIIFEYMLLYAIIQLSTVIFLFFNNTDMSNNQYLFIDLGVILVKSLLISKTGANMKIMKDKPNKNILNFKFFFSILGQAIIQVGTMSIFYFVFLTQFTKNGQSEIDENLNLYNSYLFILTVFQYSACIFSFNHNAKHKRGVFSNKTYIIYAAWVLFFMLSLITINSFNQSASNWGLVYMVAVTDKISKTSHICKILTVFCAIFNFFITISYEQLINRIFE